MGSRRDAVSGIADGAGEVFEAGGNMLKGAGKRHRRPLRLIGPLTIA